MASYFFYEAILGMSQIRSGDPFFGENVGNPTNKGYAFHLGLFHSFTSNKMPLSFQAGLQQRLNIGSENSNRYYSMTGIYPCIRGQFAYLFLTFGWTPFVWKRTSDAMGISGFTRSTGSRSYLTDFGFLWPVTPEFSLGAVASAEFVNTNGVASPSPIIGYTVLMRFYFGFSSEDLSRKHSGEFTGWRYPLGLFKN